MSSRSAQSAETELELITQAQRGDRRAFGELVRRHREGVVNVVYRMCGETNLAEDAAQEAFIRAWQHLPGYQPRSPFRNWVYRIATNVALDALRRERETVDVDTLSLAASDEGPETTLEGKERGERVRQAVLALPPASRVQTAAETSVHGTAPTTTSPTKRSVRPPKKIVAARKFSPPTTA